MGASKGEGLGNDFLQNIRETDAICMVIYCFYNKDITHVEGTIDPIRDIEIINLELIISDQEQIKKRIDKIGKKAQTLRLHKLFWSFNEYHRKFNKIVKLLLY